MKKLHKPDNPEFKFMAYNLYSLPPSLKPYEPLDTIDTRYLNQSYAPPINPLDKYMHIALYHDKWFNKPPNTYIPLLIYQYDTLKMPTKSIPSFPSVVELHDETHTCSPPSLIE